MARKLEFEELEHLFAIIEKLKDQEDKNLILTVVCEHSEAFGEIEGIKLGLAMKKESP